MSFREGHAVVIHCDTDWLRATAGIQDYFIRPSAILQARYGVPRAGSSSRIGESSRQATAMPGVDNEDPTATAEKPAASAGDKEKEKEKGWIAGEEMDKALADDGWEERFDVKWPFRYSRASEQDWEGKEFLLTRLYALLQIKLSTNTYPLLLLPPPSPPALSLPTQEAYTQLAFEQLNVPAFSILPAPLAALFALGATTGILLNIGRDRSEITVIIDSVVRYECSTTVMVGQADCESAFERLLMGDEALDKEVKIESGMEADSAWDRGRKEKLVKEICEVIWRECTGEDIEIPAATVASKAFIAAATQPDQEDDTFDVAKKLVADVSAPQPASHKSKKAQAASAAAANKAAAAAAAADVISISIPSLPGKEITIGPARHRICEPLLRGKSKGEETVWEGMGRALDGPTVSVAERMLAWEAVGVIGEVSRIKSFAPALMTYLAPFLLSSSDLPSDTQPSKVRLLHIPDYFSNYKGSTSELAPFLGGSMAAKTVFSDAGAGRHCITKVDYNARGPRAIYAIALGEDR